MNQVQISERSEQIEKLINTGMTLPKIAEQFGVNVRTIQRTAQHLRLEQKIPPKHGAQGENQDVPSKHDWLEKPGIYVVSWENDLEHVKIGRARNVSRRLSSYFGLTPHHLLLRGYVLTSQFVELERELHDRFKEFAVGYEWFSMASPIAEWLNDVIDGGSCIQQPFGQQPRTDEGKAIMARQIFSIPS